MSTFTRGCGVFSSIVQLANRNFVRQASKKASGGGNRNPKQAPGNFKGIRLWDGHRAYENDIIVHKQTKLWFHPGLNVRLGGRHNLVAKKNGIVRFTCEVTNLDSENRHVKKHYEGQPLPHFKKYVHVIPKPQHTIFKHVQSI